VSTPLLKDNDIWIRKWFGIRIFRPTPTIFTAIPTPITTTSTPTSYSSSSCDYASTSSPKGGEIQKDPLENSESTLRSEIEESPEISFPSLSRHSAVLVNNDIYVFGGFTDKMGYTNGMLVLHVDIIKNSRIDWSIPIYSGYPPTPRAGHTAVLGKEKLMYLFGGESSAETSTTTYYNELYMYNTKWNFVSPNSLVPLPGLIIPPLLYMVLIFYFFNFL